MKFQELDVKRPTDKIAKVFESHLGTRLNFDRINARQAGVMLKKVRNLLGEHRSSPSFHYSERNPDYLKLMMMEQALVNKVMEQQIVPGGTSSVAPMASPGLQASTLAMKKRSIQDAIKVKQKEIQDLQKQLAMPTMENRKRRLKESEIQQAQVVLAAQDMVDQLQKMLEQISEMQFKDLPALTDSIRNDMGVDQATKFQADATSALTTLIGAVQAAKTQLETAQGVITGQAPTPIPGVDDLGAAPDTDMPPEPGAVDVDADLSIDANLPDDDSAKGKKASLGRERR